MFGAEFVATNIVMETLQGVRYKLKIMGVPISGLSYIYGGIMLFIHNTLKKKSHYIFYHSVLESVAMREY